MCGHEDGFDGFSWEGIGIAGAIAEELAHAERERLRLLKELQPDEEDKVEGDGLDR
jgi:hypothetical protein